MRVSVLELVQVAASTLWKPENPIYEFGSRQVEGGGSDTADLRRFFPLSERWPSYVGLDIEPGPGVDIVYEPGHAPREKAGVVLCLETLEHTKDPWTLLGDIKQCMTSGAWALFTIPFNFQIHSRPDYWRITPDGMEVLLRPHFKNAYIFSSTPTIMPMTVCALAWDGTGRDAEIEKFRGEAWKWAERNCHPLYPKEGDWVLMCAHDTVGWAFMSEPRRIKGADGIEFSTQWAGTCVACYEKNGFDLSKFTRAGIHKGMNPDIVRESGRG